MTINFDPGPYARLSPEIRLYALGLIPTKRGALRSLEELGEALGQDRAKHGLIDRKLDEVSRTRERFDREHLDRPFTATATGRALFARYDILQKLSAYIASPEAPKPPRAISRLVRLVDSETLALVAVDGLCQRSRLCNQNLQLASRL
jgi:hypothetical protein